MDLKSDKDSLPKDHPRFESLNYRHRIIEGMNELIVAEAGLIAHGRGECFDYIIGEKTTETAEKAIRAAVTALILAEHPVISINGNVAALCPDEVVKLSKILEIPLEINLFYRKEGRIDAITKQLKNSGAEILLGTDEEKMISIDELSSNRRKVDPNGIYKADWVMVPLEDGDRTEALKKNGKNVIAIDLNPVSRTSIWADITIVDNIVRVLPKMIQVTKELKKLSKTEIEDILHQFDNKQNIQDTLDLIIEYVEAQKEKAFEILKKKD
jgi:4-phosphopantoate---beta-alanine ligase